MTGVLKDGKSGIAIKRNIKLERVINYFRFINYTYGKFYAIMKAGIVTTGII